MLSLVYQYRLSTKENNKDGLIKMSPSAVTVVSVSSAKENKKDGMIEMSVMNVCSEFIVSSFMLSLVHWYHLLAKEPTE